MSSYEILGSWYVLLRGSDRVVLRSAASSSARAGASRIRGAVQATNGGFFFVVRDIDGTVLAMSPIFESREACEQAMDDIRRGPAAEPVAAR
jgi:uncharacterized protein YegP (UPF0339 family)